MLSAAGSYVVKVAIGGKMVPGWPQPLHVVPGAAVAAKSWLTGASLEVSRTDALDNDLYAWHSPPGRRA